jgi:hypothetical protein
MYKEARALQITGCDGDIISILVDVLQGGDECCAGSTKRRV